MINSHKILAPEFDNVWFQICVSKNAATLLSLNGRNSNTEVFHEVGKGFSESILNKLSGDMINYINWINLINGTLID